ncbi:MAG: sigma-54 dependent transcriptional regulator [Xanthomonadales bacterium]
MPPPSILVVDDEPDIRELVGEILSDEGYDVRAAENGEAARNAFARQVPDLVLLDIWMPDVDGITLLKEWAAGGRPPCPIVIMTGHGTLETAVEATRLGAHDFVQKPISLARLLAIVNQALESRRKPQQAAVAPHVSDSAPIGGSALMQVLRSKAEQAAQHDLPVMITGEAGSGRENLARHIHARSGREGAFVLVDHCQLTPGDGRAYLLGADGDDDDGGVFDRAEGGTLFIPDLHELPADVLRTLNQVLDSGHYARNGDGERRELDCRLIVSAAEDLPERAERDEALQQLYYRVNVLPLRVPPLRERPDDVPELLRHYAEWFPSRDKLPYRPFSVAAQNRLRHYSWPGNNRELKNLVQRLLILGQGPVIDIDEVEGALQQFSEVAEPGGASSATLPLDLPLREAREQFERALEIDPKAAVADGKRK